MCVFSSVWRRRAVLTLPRGAPDEVEDVLRHRTEKVKRGIPSTSAGLPTDAARLQKQLQYYVSWVSYGPGDNSWISANDAYFPCPSCLREDRG